MTNFYKSKKWKNKRLLILKRDGYLCVNCKRYGKHTEATVVHHIKHVDEYPKLAFEDSNLQSLCGACHNKAHPEKAQKHVKGQSPLPIIFENLHLGNGVWGSFQLYENF